LYTVRRQRKGDSTAAGVTGIKLSVPSSGKLPFVKLCDGSGGLSSVATGKAGGLVIGGHGSAVDVRFGQYGFESRKEVGLPRIGNARYGGSLRADVIGIGYRDEGWLQPPVASEAQALTRQSPVSLRKKGPGTWPE
jgi:hypothetical protein